MIKLKLVVFLFFFTFNEPVADTTRSSKDLKALEFLTSPNFLATLPPKLPKTDVVRSPAALTTSVVF